MIDVGGILLSRYFWAARVLTTAIALLIVWKGIIMTTEAILYTPVEFLPYLFVIGLLAAVPIMIRSRKEFNDTNKDLLRKGQITERMAFGMDYMAADIGVVITSVVVAVLAPGVVSEAFGLEGNFALAVLIAILTTAVIGLRKSRTLTDAVDNFRDVAKIKDLEDDLKTEE